MTGEQLRGGRDQKGWTQEEAASRLGMSQPYLSLLEKGLRRVPEKLARKAATAYGLSAATLPVNTNRVSAQTRSEDTLAADLASLGYPGFSHLRSRAKKNPVEVLLTALSAGSLDSRLTEALPWVLLKYPDLDWQSLVNVAKVRDLQNKLGFVTSVARRVAERRGETDTANLLRQWELVLERSRLFLEETLCHDSLTQAEKRWLETNRPDEAKYWRLLTDLAPDHLSYAL
jgi:transcriptional regulator with XRE-family HTH domain